MNFIVQIWTFLSKKLQVRLSFLLIFSCLGYLLELFSMTMFIPFIAFLSGGGDGNIPFVKEILNYYYSKLNISDNERIYFLGMAVSLSYIISLLFKFFLNFYNSLLIRDISIFFSTQVFQKYIHQNYSLLLTKNSSQIISTITNKVGLLITSAIQPVLFIITSSIGVIIIFLGLAYVNPTESTLAILLIGSSYLILVLIFKRKIQILGIETNKNVTNVVKVVQECIGGIRDVIMSNAFSAYENKFKNEVSSMHDATAKIGIIASIPRILIEITAVVLLVTVTSLIYLRDIKSDILVLMGFLALCMQRMLPLLQQIFISWTNIRSSKSSVDDVLSILNFSAGKIKQPIEVKFKNDIKFRDVFFQHLGQSKNVLSEVNLEVKKGEKIGIFGESGVGKSTLLDLIMGLVEPSNGFIEIDGEALNKNMLTNWRSKIAHVPQSIFLLDDTVVNNISFSLGEGEVDLDRVIYCAKIACVHEAILSMDDGYQTYLGDRGALISGGQRQRIGLARAIYQNPEILILDEATNALDFETEIKVLNSINEFSKNLTVFIVSHKLSSFTGCSKIYKIDEGHVILAPSGLI